MIISDLFFVAAVRILRDMYFLWFMLSKLWECVFLPLILLECFGSCLFSWCVVIEIERSCDGIKIVFLFVDVQFNFTKQNKDSYEEEHISEIGLVMVLIIIHPASWVFTVYLVTMRHTSHCVIVLMNVPNYFFLPIVLQRYVGAPHPPTYSQPAVAIPKVSYLG